MDKAYIVHGYTANPDSNWFPWMKSELIKIGYSVDVLNMPDSHAPKVKGWMNHLAEYIKPQEGKLTIIGHSLGCIAALKHVERNPIFVDELYLVSGFIDETPILELDEFVKDKVDILKVKAKCGKIVMLTAWDDDIVPVDYSIKMAQKLNCKTVILNHGKHFIDRDGFTEFKELLFEIEASD